MRLSMIGILALVAATAFGHGSTLPPDPKKGTPPPDPGFTPEYPPTGRGTGDGDDPGGIRPDVRPGPTTRRTSSGGSWRVWWEYNREHLIGMRALLRADGAVTPAPAAAGRDPLGERRGQVLADLRRTAREADDRVLRSAALIALGRMGADEDARLFVALLSKKQPRDVHEGAAVGLGILPEIGDAAIRAEAHDFLAALLPGSKVLPPRAAGMALLGAGVRARHDPRLRMRLVGALSGKQRDGEHAADLAYACGIAGDAMVFPELARAARKGTISGRRLAPTQRAIAVQGLGLLAMSDAVPVLTTVLASRRSGVQVRRSAALALGRLLREETLDDDVVARARAALLKIFDKANDATLRGYTAVAVAGARRPTGLRPIREAIDHGGNAAVKPYCAIALGLAARTLGSDKSRSLRRFLAEELDKTHELDLGAALSIALGLARATEAEPVLRARLAKTSKPAPVRGSAAEGIGLLGKAAPESLALLKTIIREERSGKLLEDAVLALGLLGQRGIAGDLVKKLGDSESAQLQGRIMLALGHLDHAAAVDPLLAILNDGKRRPRIREFACVALGILGDRRPVDVLFALDAWFNLHATTEASSEFLRLY